MKRWVFILSIFAFLCSTASAELVRQKNVATYIQFNIWKNDGTLLSSAAGLDSEIDAWADGSAPNGFADCTNEAQEIGSTGQYYLSLTQAEMNADYIVIQVKSSSTGAVTRTIKIRTMVGDPLNVATSDDGGAINVTSGKVDEVAALTGHTAQTGDAYAIVNNGTYGNSALKTAIDAVPTASEIQTEMEENGASILDTLGDRVLGTIAAGTHNPQSGDAYAVVNNGTYGNSALNTAIGTRSSHSAADVAALILATPAQKLVTDASGRVTVGTNADKTGYALTQAFPTNFSVLSISPTTGLVDITQTAADKVWGTAARTLTALDEDSTTIDLNGTTVGGLTTWDKAGYSLSSAGIDAIWDEVQTGHAVAGSFGLYLDSKISTISATISDADIDKIWDELLSGHTTAGSTGKKLGDLPTSGTGDWTADEKADILEALSVEDGTANTDLDDIKTQIKIHR